MNEIMTLEEVAKYLRVSERTVYDWAQKGELPGGKLGTAWRFKRGDIEAWVDRKLDSGGPAASSRPVSESGIAGVLVPERIVFCEEVDKRNALLQLIDRLAATPEIRDRAELEREVFKREELMSTGIGFGVGVPHVRLGSVRNPVMAVGICRTPLLDYESLDGGPVQIICMVAARKDQHAQYLRLLSAVSALLKQPTVRNLLLECKSEQVAYKVLTGAV